MKTKLIALNAELELTKEANRTKYRQLMDKVNNIINKFFINGDACLIRSWADTDMHNDVFFRFEVGFPNTTDSERDYDWGSEIDFTYESRTGLLSINHGCIGTFNKTNVCQFYRAKLISEVYYNIDVIELNFKSLVPEAIRCLESEEEFKIESEIRSIEAHIKEEQKKEIENYLVNGRKIVYVDDCNIPYRHRLFSGTLTISRCTPKYIFFDNVLGGTIKLKKEDVVNNICKGNIGYAE